MEFFMHTTLERNFDESSIRVHIILIDADLTFTLHGNLWTCLRWQVIMIDMFL